MAELDASAAAAETESASKAFLTTIDAEPAPKSKRDVGRSRHMFRNIESTNAGPRVLEHHGQLTSLAMTLHEKVGDLLNEHEKDFFLAYRTHMYSVQRDIKMLRMKADYEEAKTKEDTTIKALEGELDWFVTEAMRLDDLCKGYKKEVDKWKQKAEALDEDRRFLEDQIKGAKRQNKILRAAAERARSSKYSALMVTKARAEQGSATSDLLTLASPSGTQPPRAELSRRPASVGATASADRKARAYSRSQTPEPWTSGPTASLTGSTAALPSTNGAGRRSAEDQAAPQVATGLGFARSPSGASAALNRSVLGNEAEERYHEAIQHLKESIVREQHNVRMLQASRAATYSKNSEMEEFFLKCIDEARKEQMRKRHISMYKEKSEKEQLLEAMLSNEDVLVCLYEKLFPHRTSIARSLGGDRDSDPRMLTNSPK